MKKTPFRKDFNEYAHLKYFRYIIYKILQRLIIPSKIVAKAKKYLIYRNWYFVRNMLKLATGHTTSFLFKNFP